VIVIVASRFDETSVRLADIWSEGDAAIMTARDLSKKGWIDRMGSADPMDSRAVIAGRRVSFGEIAGVLVRLPYVTEAELGHIIRADRGYVASEMTAYLVSWLSRLTCPVLNPPSPLSLSGPAWRTEEWLMKAAARGIPVRTMLRGSEPSRPTQRPLDASKLQTVTVVGRQSFDAKDTSTARHAQALAHLAGVELLSAVFESTEDGPALVNASTYPRINDEIADAVLRLLLSRKRDRERGGTP